MSNLNEARERLEEILATQLPDDAAAAEDFYRDMIDTRRRNVEPLLSFIETALKLMPGFIRNSLLEKAERATAGRQLDSYEDICSEVVDHAGANFHQPESLRTLVHDTCGSHPPEELTLEELQLLFCRSVYYEKQVDFALDTIYARMAAFARYMPNFLVAQVVRLALSPFIAAGVTEHLEDSHAAGLVKYFDDSFLGELVIHLSPRKTARVSEVMPFHRVAGVLHYMVNAEYYPHMAAVLDEVKESMVNLYASELNQPEERAAVIQFLKSETRARLLAELCDEQERMVLADLLDELGSRHAAVFA